MIDDAADLKAALLALNVNSMLADVMVANAKPPSSVREDASLGALIARAGAEPGELKVTSARLKNWVLNWKVMLFDAAPAFATASTNEHRLVQILALLKGLKGLLDAGTVTLTEREARLVAAIWSDQEPIVSKAAVQAQVGLDAKEFEAGIDALLRLGIVDIEDDARIVKTEWMLMV